MGRLGDGQAARGGWRAGEERGGSTVGRLAHGPGGNDAGQGRRRKGKKKGKRRKENEMKGKRDKEEKGEIGKERKKNRKRKRNRKNTKEFRKVRRVSWEIRGKDFCGVFPVFRASA
jgi:hypothetical protein